MTIIIIIKVIIMTIVVITIKVIIIIDIYTYNNVNTNNNNSNIRSATSQSVQRVNLMKRSRTEKKRLVVNSLVSLRLSIITVYEQSSKINATQT